jgi:hypothetical protein
MEANAAEETEVAQEAQEEVVQAVQAAAQEEAAEVERRGKKKSGTLGWGRLTTYRGGCRRGRRRQHDAVDRPAVPVGSGAARCRGGESGGGGAEEERKKAGMLRRVAGQDGEQWWRQQRRDSDRGGQREG